VQLGTLREGGEVTVVDEAVVLAVVEGVEGVGERLEGGGGGCGEGGEAKGEGAEEG
jgi:hypothetical protein